MQRNGKFVFIWNGVEHIASLIDQKPNVFVRFHWEDTQEDEYFGFDIQVQPLTEDVALIITDFVDPEDENDAIELWNKQIEILHRTLGA